VKEAAMFEQPVVEGARLWTPSPGLVSSCQLSRYRSFLERERGLVVADYDELHAFSVREPGEFWQTIWDFFGVVAHSPAPLALTGSMPDAHWFPGARLNYAEHALRRQDQHPALIFRSESGDREVISYAQLRQLVARARAGFRRLGVGPGDRVAAILPNRPEAVVAFLACASLGAIWSSCSPEFGAESVLDRFRQIEPKVLLVVDGYDYGGKRFERGPEFARVSAALPSLQASVVLGSMNAGTLSWDELLRDHEPLEFESVPFEHPLWILYSSGTTGLPKAIVHGHGGILLEHLKALGLHSNLGENDRFMWFTTTGWMMWNYLVSGLLLGSTLILYDGSPAFPGLYSLWKLAEEEQVTYFGTSAPYLLTCKKAGIAPNSRHQLECIRSIGTTGAPLPADGFAWVYENVHADLLLGSVSGGTDVCTAFVLSCPWLPVHAGEIQCAGLGAKVEAYDETGRAIEGEVGELVLSAPLPSMPIYFWNDPGDQRRLDSYFSTYPGVWRHGDWIKKTPRGGFVIYGRSDSTLNRGGVRMGTSEFYRVVEALPEVLDSLVVDTATLDDPNGKLWLFVVLRQGNAVDSAFTARVRDVIRRELSPRHVPDRIRAVASIPKTLNGKKLEVPVKKILLGGDPALAASPGTLLDASALEPFIELGRSGAGSA
jgi:acetoacetyl-CoA synthetase